GTTEKKWHPMFLGVVGGSMGQPLNPTRSPLSGRILGNPYPGLKPWAVLSDHFMVNKRHRSRFSSKLFTLARSKMRGSLPSTWLESLRTIQADLRFSLAQ